ncbi:MAG TPA: TMEM175 family protein [Candidatus Baltobacteraceae bacterium]|nr:TMEM175 family protein [Candidatus Baltobacteraceae bacterium]
MLSPWWYPPIRTAAAQENLSARFAGAHEERLTHRLEAFSDIVMGFSLAQMSLSFVMPAHPADVYTHSIAPIAFVATFLIVATTWYSHHWLFDHLFVPTASTIVVNFATLASIIWLTYQFQLYVHFAPTVDHAFATVSYLVTFGTMWILLALLYGISLRVGWNSIPADDREAGAFKTGRLATIGLATILTTLIVWEFHQPIETTFWVIFVAGVLWRIVGRNLAGRFRAVR